ncbi:MAG: DUF881 domain-containing protein [Dactylosporangium sp.]|nr:DUF881 domain-containing protein [Dactylosporangium sp.]NNJ60672.1 DUF881 domain-containing protein [Dactylosporangium sp.]
MIGWSRPARDRAGSTEKPQPAEASSLLSDLLRQPLEPGYADAARRRADLGPRTGWRAGTASMAKLVTLLAIGLLLAVAYHQVVADEPQVSKARADLVADVKTTRDETEDLQRRADDLRQDVARRRDDLVAGDEDMAALRAREASAGLVTVAGRGVTVEVRDATAPVDPVTGKPTGENPGTVLDRDLQDIVNALWRLDAEAIAINGQRLTGVSTIRTAGGVILVDFQPITSPYRVSAIGPPDLSDEFDDSAVAARFRRYVKTYRMRFSIKRRADLTLPAASEPRLRYAHPPSPSGSDPASPSAGPRRSGP